MKIPRTLMLAGKVSRQRTDLGRRFRSVVPCHENHPTDGMSPRRPQSAVPFPVHRRRCRPSVRPSGRRKYSTDKNGLQHLAHLNRSPFGSPAFSGRGKEEPWRQHSDSSTDLLYSPDILCTGFSGENTIQIALLNSIWPSSNKRKQKSALVSVYELIYS